MTIEDLKIIKAINDTKNITYAARLLFKDESTVSKAIKRIERELGVKLYYVSHNRPEMTSVGEKAAEIATNALSVIEELYLLREEENKTNKMVVATDIELLETIIVLFMSIGDYVGTEFEEQITDNRTAKDLFDSGKCEVAITLSPLKTKRSATIIQYDEIPILVCKKGTIKINKEKASLKDLNIDELQILGKKGSRITLVENYILQNGINVKLNKNEDPAIFYGKLKYGKSPAIMNSTMASVIDKRWFDMYELYDDALRGSIYVTIGNNNTDIINAAESVVSKFEHAKIIKG